MAEDDSSALAPFGPALQIFDGVRRVAYDLPAKLAAYFTQGTWVGIAKDNYIFWLKGHDEICIVTSERHKALWLGFPDGCLVHPRGVKGRARDLEQQGDPFAVDFLWRNSPPVYRF